MEIRELYYTTKNYFEPYLDYVDRHRAKVREAGLHIVGSIPLSVLVKHDLSKYSEAEFPYYAMRHYGPIEDRQTPHNVELYYAAWLHHVHNNDHHWEHWMIPTATVSTPVVMPVVCIREMVADLLSFGGPVELAEYLKKHLAAMSFHPRTKPILADILGGVFRDANVANYRLILDLLKLEM